MKKLFKILGVILTLFALTLTITAFVVKDPNPDFQLNNLTEFDRVSLKEVKSDNQQKGMFKSTVTFIRQPNQKENKEFYGQEIWIKNNTHLDRILVGVTNNLISRVEIWNNNELIETRELGFVGKMTWGADQEMAIQFYDQTNSKYPNQSNIRMRFYSGTGFLGDIGTIGLNLTKYGDLSGEKKISVFSQTLESELQSNPTFKNLRVWKNFNSFD